MRISESIFTWNENWQLLSWIGPTKLYSIAGKEWCLELWVIEKGTFVRAYLPVSSIRGLSKLFHACIFCSRRSREGDAAAVVRILILQVTLERDERQSAYYAFDPDSVNWLISSYPRHPFSYEVGTHEIISQIYCPVANQLQQTSIFGIRPKYCVLNTPSSRGLPGVSEPLKCPYSPIDILQSYFRPHCGNS